MTIEKLVHVVDDEDSVRRSLDFLLGTAGYRVARWPDGPSFLRAVDPSVQACVLLDMRMPGMEGDQVQREMAQRGINLPVIVLTGHGDVPMAVKAMQSGAVDFLEKPADREQLLRAIDRAFRQQGDQAQQRSNADWALTQVNALTEREREVLDGLACGYPNKTIAFDLGISARTVEVYRANVMSKLGVNSFADALRIAFAAGMGLEEDWRQDHADALATARGTSARSPISG